MSFRIHHSSPISSPIWQKVKIEDTVMFLVYKHFVSFYMYIIICKTHVSISFTFISCLLIYWGKKKPHKFYWSWTIYFSLFAHQPQYKPFPVGIFWLLKTFWQWEDKLCLPVNCLTLQFTNFSSCCIMLYCWAHHYCFASEKIFIDLW